MQHELRDYQKAAVQAAVNWLRYKDNPAIVVIPTGGGKTHIIKSIIEHFHSQNKRVVLLAHRKELLEQAGAKLNVDFGYYSASIGIKDLDQQVTIANIQSIYSNPTKDIDLIIIDECHHVSNNDDLGQYWQFIKNNPQAKIFGLTATPFRTESGKLKWGDIVYEIGYKQLFDAKYLCSISNKVTNTPKLDDIKIKLGDFAQLQLENTMIDIDLVVAAVTKIIEYSEDKHSVLIFTVSRKHSDVLQGVMIDNDIDAYVIDSMTHKKDREEILTKFKNREIKYLINCEILLEGFDAPCIDMIVGLRPTKSKILHEQMIGRGVRLYEGKDKCLLLDMAGNLQEHGGIGSPCFIEDKEEKEKLKGKICPKCEEFVQPLDFICPECKYEFPKPEYTFPQIKHNSEPDLYSETVFNPITEYEVFGVRYSEHTNREKGTKSLRVDYLTKSTYGKISEWLSPHSDSQWARNKAWQFFKERGYDIYGEIEEYPMENLLFFAQQLKQPTHITVKKEGKWDKIISHIFAEEPKKEEPQENLSNFLDDELIW